MYIRKESNLKQRKNPKPETKFYLFNHQILAFKTVANPTQAKYGINK